MCNVEACYDIIIADLPYHLLNLTLFIEGIYIIDAQKMSVLNAAQNVVSSSLKSAFSVWSPDYTEAQIYMQQGYHL